MNKNILYGKKAMIMAAGLGTRLMPLTSRIPKPMFPVLNKPLLEHIINKCTSSGVKDFMVNIHHLPEKIETYFGNGEKFGANINYSLEKKLMGTAGSIKRVSTFFDDTFIILSGDVYSEIDLEKMMRFHKESGSAFTIAVKKTDDVSKYGVVEFDEQQRIKRFQEKPRKEDAISDFINLGIYIVEPFILDMIPASVEYDFAKDLFPRLLKAGIPFNVFKTDAYWNDIGSINEYYDLNFKLLKGDKGMHKVIYGRNTKVGSKVKLDNSVIIGNDVKLSGGSSVSDSIIFDNTRIGKNVKIENCIVSGDLIFSRSNTVGFNLNDKDICSSYHKKSFSERISELLISFTDKTVALVALILLAPLFALVAAAIKLDSKGPVFYRSKRMQSPDIELKGNNWLLNYAGREVNFYVFRTMFTDADKQINALDNNYKTGPFIKIKNDPRVTRIGRFLRKSSIDELPLLYSVLKGDLSLVGLWALPRYEAESMFRDGITAGEGENLIDLTEVAHLRFNGRAGLAGLWQSHGRSNLTAEERAVHDSFQAVLFQNNLFDKRNQYIKYLSMIYKTFKSVVKREGAM